MGEIIEIEDEETKCAVCKEPAQHKCAACKNVAYCGRAHQKQHWKIHKPICKKLPYKIETNSQLGRHVIAQTDIKPGEIIMQETPIIVGPRITIAEPVCLGCHKAVDPNECGMNRCPRCLWPACSSRCPGLTDVNTHAGECGILKLGSQTIVAFNDFKYEAILPLRCLILQRRSPKKYEELKLMEAHMNKRGPGTEVYEEINIIVKYLCSNFLQKLPENVLDDTSAECLHWVCGVIDVNALDIDKCIQGLYTNVCLLEHNCLPNTKHTFLPESGNTLCLRASVEITTDSHISTMYTNALWGTQARKEHLLITKYFNCSCDRCSDPTELSTYLSALKCLNEESGTPCGKYMLPTNPLDNESDWKCSDCTATLSSNEVRYLVAQLGEQVDTLVQDNPNVIAVEEMLKKVQTLLHPNHYHCYALKHSLVQLYGTQKEYVYSTLSVEAVQRKIDMCRELIWITNKLDPGHSRLTMYLGVLLYELHTALLELTKRNVCSNGEKIKMIKEAKQLLEQNLTILEHEPPMTTGYDMAILNTIALTSVNKTLKEITNK